MFCKRRKSWRSTKRMCIHNNVCPGNIIPFGYKSNGPNSRKTQKNCTYIFGGRFFSLEILLFFSFFFSTHSFREFFVFVFTYPSRCTRTHNVDYTAYVTRCAFAIETSVRHRFTRKNALRETGGWDDLFEFATICA